MLVLILCLNSTLPNAKFTPTDSCCRVDINSIPLQPVKRFLFFLCLLAARTEIDPKYLEYTDLKDQHYMCTTCRVVGGMHGACACGASYFNAVPITVSIADRRYLCLLVIQLPSHSTSKPSSPTSFFSPPPPLLLL